MWLANPSSTCKKNMKGRFIFHVLSRQILHIISCPFIYYIKNLPLFELRDRIYSFIKESSSTGCVEQEKPDSGKLEVNSSSKNSSLCKVSFSVSLISSFSCWPKESMLAFWFAESLSKAFSTSKVYGSTLMWFKFIIPKTFDEFSFSA